MSIINSKYDEDLKEIIEVVIEKLKEKYVLPIEEMVRSKDMDIKDKPSPEINLLKAFKPFLNSRSCDIIEKVVSSYQVASVANAMTEDFLESQQQRQVQMQNTRNTDSNEAMMLQVENSSPGKPIILLIFLVLIILLETH